MTPRLFSIAILSLCAVFGSPQPLSAQVTAPPGRAGFDAELVNGGVSATDREVAWLGLDIHLDPKWHTYWRSPGDAGAAPEFDWTGSDNIARADIEWPAPRRISNAGFDSFGYVDRVLLPIKLTLEDPSKPAHVRLKTALYVCATICTSNELHFEAEIGPQSGSAAGRALIAQWRERVPKGGSESLSIRSISLARGESPLLRFEAAATPPLQNADAFIDGDTAIAADKPRLSAGTGGTSVIDLPLTGLGDKPLPDQLHVTIVDGDRSVTAPVPPGLFGVKAETATAASPKPSEGALWLMIAIALLGGLVLNFMPCVFPVLSLKVLSLVGNSSNEPKAIRLGFLALAAGVLVSFLALAAALATLKIAGADIGWGIQFQQPIFIVAMIGVLTLMAANLIGLFEVNLSWRVSGALGRVSGGHSLGAQFFNGFVMTLLATPCSAPFVGTAVAYSLSQGPFEIVIVFASLGLGMASPYLLAAALPRAARILPRPGRWMVGVRYVAAVALAVTAIWLLVVLAEISGARPAIAIGATFGILVWAGAVARRRFAHVIAGFLIACLVGASLIRPGPAEHSIQASSQGVQWQTFAPGRIDAMVRDGKTVFVDIGATWCLTCKINEAFILDSDAIRSRLRADIVPMQADWTKSDTTIARYLQSHGRYGLPFNIVVGPASPEGIILPELLTETAVLKAFDKASGHTQLNKGE